MNDKEGYTIICSRCGNEMKSTSRYCMKCGNLDIDHPDNQNMKKFYKNRMETYSVSSGQAEFVQDNGQVKQNLGDFSGVNIFLTVGTFIYIAIICLVSVKYIQNSNTMLDFVTSSVYIPYLLISLGFIYFFSTLLLFAKMGVAWWKALIPVYSTWVETKITGLAWWWCPIFLGISALSTYKNLYGAASFAIIIIFFNYNYNLAKKFGKSDGFAVLLTLLPIIGIPILAFGSAKYNASAKTDKNGIFAVDHDMVK